MITCEEFLAEFADYLENQVSSEVRQELGNKDCPNRPTVPTMKS